MTGHTVSTFFCSSLQSLRFNHAHTRGLFGWFTNDRTGKPIATARLFAAMLRSVDRRLCNIIAIRTGFDPLFRFRFAVKIATTQACQSGAS